MDFWQRAQRLAADHVRYADTIQQANASHAAEDVQRPGSHRGQNTITISEGGQLRSAFRVSYDPYAARALFAFLAENLRPGFTVELDNPGGSGAMTLPSGEKIPAEHYPAVMGIEI